MSLSKRVLLVQAFLACFYFSNSFAETDKVIRVVGGDTVILNRIGRARLISVDTPETVHTQKLVQFFGKEASNYTRSQLEGKTVRVEYDGHKKDQYNRTLVHLFLQDGTLL